MWINTELKSIRKCGVILSKTEMMRNFEHMGGSQRSLEK